MVMSLSATIQGRDSAMCLLYRRTPNASSPESGCRQRGSRPSANRLARHHTSPFSASDTAHLFVKSKTHELYGDSTFIDVINCPRTRMMYSKRENYKRGDIYEYGFMYVSPNATTEETFSIIVPANFRWSEYCYGAGTPREGNAQFEAILSTHLRSSSSQRVGTRSASMSSSKPT